MLCFYCNKKKIVKPRSRRSGPWCPWAGVCGAAQKRPGRQGQLQPEGAGREGGAMSPEPRPGVQRAACPGLSLSSHLPFPCSSPARTRRPCPGSSGGWPGQRGGEGWAQGGGRERGVRSVRPSADVCRAPAVGRALLDSLAPSTGWTRAWKSSEGPGGQTLTGTGRGLWRAQERLSLARLSVGTWSAAPRLREASGLGPPPTPPSLLVIFPMFIETPSSEASLAIPPRGSWASSTQAGRSFTPECSQHPAGGSWPVLQARGPRATCQGSAWAEGNLVHA